jgi:hypothetical protein
MRSGIDHRFDCEHHAGLHETRLRGVIVVEHLQSGVKERTDAMPHELTHHRVPAPDRNIFDCPSDVGEWPTRSHSLDSGVQASTRSIDQAPRDRVDFPHAHSYRAIAVSPADENTDV